MKKVLFIVNGLGLGNSTRCESIINALVAKGIIVDVLTSNNGIYYFRNRDCVSNIYEFQALYYRSKGGKLSIWCTILAVPHFIWIYLKNVKFLKTLIQNNNYSGLVIDSDYTILWLKKKLKIPVFALNNADIIVEECKKLSALPREISMQYLIEKCDDWFHRRVPDVVLSPSLCPHNYTNGVRLKHFAPFVRDGLNVRPPNTQLKNILIMLSGSQFGSRTEFLKQLQIPSKVKIDVIGRDGESNDWITFHGKLYDNKNLINNADMMVVNGGFSAVSEAVVLRKPVVVIPIPNHAEQFINARLVETAGLGLSATMEDVVDKINEMICQFAKFVEAHYNYDILMNGEKEAAKVIYEVLKN